MQQIRQSLNDEDVVIGQVEYPEEGELGQVFHLLDHVVLQEYILEDGEVVQILNLGDHIVLQVQTLQIDVLF